MIEIEPMGAGAQVAGPPTRPRLTERHVLAFGLLVSGSFVVAALSVGVVSVARGGSPWAALHLALAGAAMVAIGTFMPHFAVTLAGTRPSRAIERLVAVLALGIGAGLVVGGMVFLGRGATVAGVACAAMGIVLTTRHTLAPTRNPLARRHPIALAAYLLALGELAVSGTIAGLLVVGGAGVAEHWVSLRTAHAWLALGGAVSLTITATLVYLVPTVLGARIRPSPALAIALIGVAAGPLVSAAGFVAGSRAVVLGGLVATLIGSVGLLAYVIDVTRRRGAFTSERAWREVAAWHLGLGPAWFTAALVAATVDAATRPDLGSWSIGVLAIPLVGGWLLQELVGSWTHLVPSVTFGSPEDHARQRAALAWAGRPRLVAWNVGLALAWTDLVPALQAIGAMLVVGAVAASVGSLARALAIGRSR